MSYRELGYVGLGLFLGILAAVFINHARAANNSQIVLSDTTQVDGGTLTKVYDPGPNVICYVYQRGEFGSLWYASSMSGAASVSCLKNN